MGILRRCDFVGGFEGHTRRHRIKDNIFERHCETHDVSRRLESVTSSILLITHIFLFSLQGPNDDSAGIPGGPGYAQQHYAQNHELQQQLAKFWTEMMEDVKKVGTDPAEFKSQQLPLARIKKVSPSTW